MKKGHYCLLVILLSLSIISRCEQATPAAAAPAETPVPVAAPAATNGNGATTGEVKANGNGNGNGNGQAAEAPAPVPVLVSVDPVPVAQNGNGKATNGQSTQTQTKTETQATTTTTTTAVTAEAPAPAPVRVEAPAPAPVEVVAPAPVLVAPAPTPAPVEIPAPTPVPVEAAPAPAPVVVAPAPAPTPLPLTITTTPAPAPVVVAPAPTPAPAPVVAPAPAPAATVGSSSPQCPTLTKPALCETAYKPVCGFLANGTSTTFANKCTACNFKDVVGFTEGFCQSSETKKPDPSAFTAPAPAPAPTTQIFSTVQKITLVPPPVPGTKYDTPEALGKTTTACPDNQQRYLTQCSGQYKPVCATKINGSKQTVLNACTACSDGTTIFFRDSPCTLTELRTAGNLTPCTKNIVPFCRFNVNPVCVYNTDGTTVTQSNSCIGCLSRKAYAFRNGECEVTADGDRPRESLCGRNPNEALLCLLEYKPVCVKLQDGVRKTYDQACDACKLTTFASYKSGRCGRS